MILAIALGALAGIAGFLPLFGALRLTKWVTQTSNLSNMGVLLLGLLVSFLILFLTLLMCRALARNLVLAFGVAEVLTLIVVAIGFGIIKLVRR